MLTGMGCVQASAYLGIEPAESLRDFYNHDRDMAGTGCALNVDTGWLTFDSIWHGWRSDVDPICKRPGYPEVEVPEYCPAREAEWTVDTEAEYHFLTIGTDDILGDPTQWAADNSPAVVTTVPSSVLHNSAGGAGLWDTSAVSAEDGCVEEAIEAVGRDGAEEEGEAEWSQHAGHISCCQA